jgi:hypothetical protein
LFTGVVAGAARRQWRRPLSLALRSLQENWLDHRGLPKAERKAKAEELLLAGEVLESRHALFSLAAVAEEAGIL